MPSYIIKCRNCGHGTDIRGCPQSPMVIEGISICVFCPKIKRVSCNNKFSFSGKSNNCSLPDYVNKVRQQMVEHIDLWLSECRKPIRSSI